MQAFLACVAQVFVFAGLLVTYRLAQGPSRAYPFEPSAVVTLAEVVKLVAALSFVSLRGKLSRDVPLRNVGIIGLAFSYSVNNLLQFETNRLADPGTCYLMKSGMTLFVGLLQWSLTGAHFTTIQWLAMIIQALGMVVMQWDECQVCPDYALSTYALMLLASVLTGVNTVINARQIQRGDSGDPILQSVGLYFWGAIFNFIAYLSSGKELGSFFKGFTSWEVYLILFFHMMLGLVMPAVYKYGGAVVKMMAGDVVSVVLVAVSVRFFGVPLRLRCCTGAAVVLLSIAIANQANYSGSTNASSITALASVASFAVGVLSKTLHDDAQVGVRLLGIAGYLVIGGLVGRMTAGRGSPDTHQREKTA